MRPRVCTAVTFKTLFGVDSKASNAEGICLLRSGQFMEALAAFQESIQMRPDYPVAWYGLYQTYVRIGSYPEAEQALDELTGLIPGKTLALTASMDWLQRLYPEVAEMQLENQKRDVHVYGNPALHRQWAMMEARRWLHLGHPAAAISTLEPIWNTYPNNAQTSGLMAEAYRRTGDLESAQLSLKHALVSVSEHPVILGVRARIAFDLGEYKKPGGCINKWLATIVRSDLPLNGICSEPKIERVRVRLRSIGGRFQRIQMPPSFSTFLGGASETRVDTLVMGLGCAPSQPEPKPKTLPHIVLISLDTTRADHLGSYGYTAGKTDTLDALAEQGTRFHRAYSPAPLTIPAHISLFTGLYPPRHGVRTNGDGMLTADHVTLTKELKQHGYRTAGSVSAL